MNDYELVVLTSKDYGKKIINDVEKVAGGKSKITKTDDWGVKALTYKIKKQTEANYFLFVLSLAPQEVFPLDQSLRRNENVIRHLLTRSDKQSLTFQDKRKVISDKAMEKKETKKVEKKEVKKASAKKVSKK